MTVAVKGDPVREAKWNARKREWYRLAGGTADPHIATVCRIMAEQAASMEEFWSK